MDLCSKEGREVLSEREISRWVCKEEREDRKGECLRRILLPRLLGLASVIFLKALAVLSWESN